METHLIGDFERDVFTPAASTTGGVSGRASPYNIPNGRPGSAWQIDAEGFPTIVEYAGTIWEPGVFARTLRDARSRVRFLFQHGDAGESWSGSPFGSNALPIGTFTDIHEEDDGLYFKASFSRSQLAQSVRELSEIGALNELSISYVVREAELRTAADGKMYRHATDADLFDISVVVWGQYGTHATIAEVASADVQQTPTADVLSGEVPPKLDETQADDETGDDEEATPDDETDTARDAARLRRLRLLALTERNTE